MTLTFRKAAGRPHHANVLLYGPPKTGKTAGACSAPGAVALVNLDLPNATQFAHSRDGEGRIHEIEFEGMQTLIDLHEAVHQKPAFDTVVVDPIGELHRRLLEEASGRAVRPTLNQYGDVGTHLERFCRMLCEAPVNAIFVAHETPVKDEASGTMERLPWTGTTNPALGQKIMGMVDIVGYTAVLEVEGQAEPDYVAQLISAQGRRGGDRFNALGDWRKLDLTEWFQTAGVGGEATPDETTTTTEKEAAPA
jgi:hypothetical protein